MADLAKLIIKMEADNTKLMSKLDQANKKIDRFGKKTQSVSKKVKASFKVMATTLSFVALGAALKSSIAAYAKQEQAVKQLETRLKSTGNVVGYSSKELQGFASSLQKVTTFGDEAIIQMQGLLLTFTDIRGPIFKQAEKAILNVSTAMGQDLKSSAIQVGKALNDPILGVTALSRSGIQFSKTQKDMIKSLVNSGQKAKAQAIILKELNVQVGGAAEAAAGGTGIFKQISNALGDLSEQTGKAIMGSKLFQSVLKGVLDAANAMAGNTSIADWAKDTNVFLKSIAAVGKTIEIAFRDLGQSMGALAASSALIVSGDFSLVGNVFSQLKADVAANNQELSDFYLNLSGVETKIKSATKIAGTASPTGSLPQGRKNGVRGLNKLTSDDQKFMKTMQVWWKQQDTAAKKFRETQSALAEQRVELQMTSKELFVYQKVSALGVGATDAMRESTSKLASKLYNEREAMSKLNDKSKEQQNQFADLKSAIHGWGDEFATTMLNANNSFSSFAKNITKQLAKIAISKLSQPLFDKFGGFFGGLFGKATGGHVNAKQPYLVGERGPELFIPSGGGNISPNSALNNSQGVTQNISIDARGAQPGMEQKIRAAAEEGARKGYMMVLDDVNRNGPIRGALA